MKKIIIALYLLAVVFQSVAFAEPYKSSRVPPENILLKVVVAKWGDKRQRIIGKFKDSDNYYKVYHIYPNA